MVGDSEKLKNGWKYGAEAGSLKRRGLVLYLIFSRIIYLNSEITLSFAKLRYTLRYALPQLHEKSHSKLSKNEPKNIPHKLRFISLFVKGFKRFKIDF